MPNAKCLLILTGLIAGLSFWYSQEVGVAVIIAIIISLLVFNFSREQIYLFPTHLGLFVIGIGIVSLPILSYFAVKQGLQALITNITEVPKYIMLGNGSQIFHNIIGIGNVYPPEGSFMGYLYYLVSIFRNWFPILLFIIISLYLSICALTQNWSLRRNIILGILVSDMILFRKVLGRGGVEIVLPGVFIMCTFMTESLFLKIKMFGKKINSLGIIYSIAFISIIFVYLDYIILDYLRPGQVQVAENTIFRKFSIKEIKEDMAPLSIERAENIYIEKKWAECISNTVTYIKNTTEPEDYIFVFPNEPMYYFLTDRLNPTRFGMSYGAVTTKMREEVVQDLEVKKPKYVIYSLNTWRIDGISERTQVPEITKYIMEKYQVEKEFDGVRILRYKENP